jgi:hypothetical protein
VAGARAADDGREEDAGAAPNARRPGRAAAGRRWRWRWPVALALLVLAAGAVIALLQPSPTVYLDPDSTGPAGGHALADLVTARGARVIRVTAPPGANAGGESAGVELVTSAGLLSSAQLAQAARFRGDIIVTDPDQAALRVLAPAVTMSGSESVQTAPPLCNDRTASLAGDVDAGGVVLQTSDPAAVTCYPGAGGYFFVQYRDENRTVTVLGSGAPLTNAALADNGDAALALNLLRTATTITWLVPNPDAQSAGASTGQRSFFSLVPWPAYLIAIQLVVAALLAAAWRARRLGPLVAERIPVVVRASETVEGHGRLYQARRARGRAAAELRAAARARIARRLGVAPANNAPQGAAEGPAHDMPHGATDDAPDGAGVPGRARAITAATAATAASVGEHPDKVTSLLDGPPPATDQELVALADDLDSLERKVRHP